MAYYFASDIHAGLELCGKTAESQQMLIGWLDRIAPDAEGIFLLGDIFDFWFEYKNAVPPGFDPLLKKLTELTAAGIPVHFFPGNHDMWTMDHLSRVCGLVLHPNGLYTTLYGKRIYMEHGDRQSIRRPWERVMQRVFRSAIAQRIARAVIPQSRMLRFGSRWSESRRAKEMTPLVFHDEKEGVVRFARKYMRRHEVDLFLFGHLHIPTFYPLSPRTGLYLLGDWIETREPIYGKLDEHGFSLEAYTA